MKVNLPELGAPSPHIELVEMLDRTLNQFNMQISDEQFAVRRDGSVLFGVLQISFGEQTTASPTMPPHTCASQMHEAFRHSRDWVKRQRYGPGLLIPA